MRFRKSFLLPIIFMAMTASADQTPKGPIVPVQAATSVFNFDRLPVGSLPPGFQFVATGPGAAPRWRVMADPQAPSPPHVLVQDGQAAGGDHYAFALLESPPITDGSITIKFKAIRGEETQGAGFVYRYQSPETCYVVWASAKDDACTITRFSHGKSKMIDTKQAIVTANIWHTMRLVFARDTYALYLNDDLVMGGTDKGLRTPGQVGLCTQADAVTEFDDLMVAR